jgi:hypothetical protein
VLWRVERAVVEEELVRGLVETGCRCHPPLVFHGFGGAQLTMLQATNWLSISTSRITQPQNLCPEMQSRALCCRKPWNHTMAPAMAIEPGAG